MVQRPVGSVTSAVVTSLSGSRSLRPPDCSHRLEAGFAGELRDSADEFVNALAGRVERGDGRG